MKKLLAITFAASLACFAAPSFAKGEPIIVERTAAQWVADASDHLGKRLGVGSQRVTDAMKDGIVQIRFESDANGQPTNLRYIRKSGNFYLDRAAWRAVATLDMLHEMPADIVGKPLQANVINASSEHDYRRLAQTLREEESRRLASSPDEREVFAFNAVAQPVG